MRIHDISYHVEVSGSGDPLLLLHGFTGSSQNWKPLVSALQGEFQVIAPDLLGHGRTDAPDDPGRYAMALAAADLIAILEALAVKPVSLLGYSMGGRLALYLATHYPHYVKRLVLESASPGLELAADRAQRQLADDALAQQIEDNGIDWFVNYWEQIPLFATQHNLSKSQRNFVRQQRLLNSPTGLANSLRGMGTGVQPSLWRDLGQLNMPVLLITGRLDTKFTALAGQMASALPQVEIVTLDQAGHTVHLEMPEAYVSTVAEFLTAHA